MNNPHQANQEYAFDVDTPQLPRSEKITGVLLFLVAIVTIVVGICQHFHPLH